MIALRNPNHNDRAVDQVIMCCECGNNIALTIYHGDSLCNDCYMLKKK